MAIYHVLFKMTRGIEDDEVIGCDEHAFDHTVELTDEQADQVWELLNEGGIDNTVAEWLDLERPIETSATPDFTGVTEIEATLAAGCSHA